MELHFYGNGGNAGGLGGNAGGLGMPEASERMLYLCLLTIEERPPDGNAGGLGVAFFQYIYINEMVMPEGLGVAFFATGPGLGLIMYILTTLEFPTHYFNFHLLTTSVNAKYYY